MAIYNNAQEVMDDVAIIGKGLAKAGVEIGKEVAPVAKDIGRELGAAGKTLLGGLFQGLKGAKRIIDEEREFQARLKAIKNNEVE